MYVLHQLSDVIKLMGWSGWCSTQPNHIAATRGAEIDRRLILQPPSERLAISSLGLSHHTLSGPWAYAHNNIPLQGRQKWSLIIYVLIFMVTLNNHTIPRTALPTSNSILSLIQDWWRVQDSLNGSWSL